MKLSESNDNFTCRSLISGITDKENWLWHLKTNKWQVFLTINQKTGKYEVRKEYTSILQVAKRIH